MDGSVQVSVPDWGVEGPLPPSSTGAVIIPAHNEAGVIGRTLGKLAPLTSVDGVEVIVVCNGCTDRTAEIARGFEGVRVEELGVGSKIAALNHGNEVATAWPRLYLDADIDVAPSAVLTLFRVLAEKKVLAARLPSVYLVENASLPVRAYYRARSRIPAPAKRLWGAGGYGLSWEGAELRVPTFDDVTADDSWFDAQFADSEKDVVEAPPMVVRTPQTVGDLLAVLARQRRGYVEMGISSHASPRGRALLASIDGPMAAFDAVLYGVVSALARRKASRALRSSGARPWERDGSSRTPVTK